MIELLENTQTDVWESARRVLMAESAALKLLSDAVPSDFARAVDTILNASGRVIVSGIGKSGHIGRKISATFTSTGTPSYFVHAAEASHGDLGMITDSDVCLLLSNSGETSELQDILAYTQRFSIPLIAISSHHKSTLMRTASHCLLLPQVKEACPNGMAPTTSTTMMLALGDALAVALMEARGFKPEHFHEFHPGGRLGAKMHKVANLMHHDAELPVVSPDTPMSDTLLAMTSKGFGIAIVTNSAGQLEGVVTDGDLRRNMTDLMNKTAGEIATKTPITVNMDMLSAQALALMNDHAISVLPVIDKAKKTMGVIHIHDLLRVGVV